MSWYPKKTIYLAGPITGMNHDDARYGWRKEFANMIEEAGRIGAYRTDHIYCSSPMRGKEFLKNMGVLGSNQSQFSDHAMATSSGITTRDRNDVKTCDLMLACFLESGGRLSGGTFIEYGWADAWRKPIIVVGAKDDPNVFHLMAEDIRGYHVETLEEALPIIIRLLTPGL